MIEIWRDIIGYEGLYQVSSWGRVRSLNYNHTGRVQVMKLKKGTHGYFEICLHKGKSKKFYRVHRLVGMAFPDMVGWIEKVKGKPFAELVINHKDQNKENNHVSNLEWCDEPYNDNYGTRNERISKAMTNGKLAKRVAQYTLDGKLVKIWESLSEIARQTGWSKGNIGQCCLGKTYSQCYGFIWRYID